MFDRRQFLKNAGSLGAAAVALPVLGPSTLNAAVSQADQEGPTDVSAPGTELSKEQILDELQKKGFEALGKYGNCAQSSFAVLQEHFGLEGNEIHRALSAMPQIAIRGETCGAVTGSLMALGLVFGSDKDDQNADWRAVYQPAREFCSRFEEAEGSTQCRDIHTLAAGRWYDTLDPDEKKAYNAKGGGEACRGAVASGVRIAAELILEEGGRSEAVG